MDRATKMFVNYMKTKHDLVINDELVWEAITMYQGELDHELFPIENLDNLPDPLLFLTTSFVDKQEQEWIFCIVADNDNSTHWYTAACLIDGELFEADIPLDLGLK